MSDRAFLELLDAIYDAALEPSLWPIALDRLSLAHNGAGAVLLDLGSSRPMLSHTTNIEEEVQRYDKLWWQRDVYAEIVLKHLGPGIHADYDVIDEAEKKRSDFYQDFLRPCRIEGMLTLGAAPYTGSLVALSIQRAIGSGPPSGPERSKLATIGRHVSRAIAAGRRLSRTAAIAGAMADRLGHFDCAVAAVDRSARVLLANERFERLGCDILFVRHNRLVIVDPAARRLVQRMIGEALTPSQIGTAPDYVVLTRPTALLPLVARVVSVSAGRAERQWSAVRNDVALVMVLTPDDPAYPPADSILCALGLTPAQARVGLMIGSGRTVSDTAEALGISVETVRTTLKHLYARLGINRQSDLVRLVSRAVPFSI